MKHTEYIVPIGEEAKEFDEIFIGVLRKHKELVRCKDCKYSVEEYNDGECYCDYNRELRYIKDWDHYCGLGREERRMSYDLRIAVKVDGTDIFAQIAEPEYASPTYNLGDMFRACMDWDYTQSEFYPCSEAITKVERGIRELRTNKSAYTKYNPSNGWGDISSALKALESLRECIYEQAEEIPIEHLWMAW